MGMPRLLRRRPPRLQKAPNPQAVHDSRRPFHFFGLPRFLFGERCARLRPTNTFVQLFWLHSGSKVRGAVKPMFRMRWMSVACGNPIG